MTLIANDIVTSLKTVSYGYPNVSVVRSFNTADKTYPRIVVRQLQDSTLNRATTPTSTSNPNGIKEVASLVAIQIEIYTKDCVNSSNVVKSRDVASDELYALVNDKMFTAYGLNRDMVSEIYRYDSDTAVRYVRYSGVMDSGGYIYRSTKQTYTSQSGY